MKFPKSICFALCCVVSAATHAGAFNAVTYGDTVAKDIASEVTEQFTVRYPTSKWSVFVWTASGVTDKGIPHCTGIAGVVPKGTGVFPLKRYLTTSFNPDENGSKTVGELRAWSVRCAKSAVANMMSDSLEKMYLAPQQP